MSPTLSTSCLHFACACGNTRFSARGAPLLRFFCHCSLCQRFNQAAFADVCVFGSAQVEPPAEGQVRFARYRPPPNVHRGRCSHCQAAVLERFEMPLLPSLVMVPSAIFQAPQQIPDAAAHLFYESRLSDASDGLPRFEGYWSSQLGFGRLLLGAMRERSRV